MRDATLEFLDLLTVGVEGGLAAESQFLQIEVIFTSY